MKKLIAGAVIAGTLLITPGAAMADTSTTTAPTTTPTSAPAPAATPRHEFAAKTKAIAAIDKRLAWLDVLTGHVNNAKNLSADHKATLLDKIDADRRGLRSLRAQIVADDDGPTFRQHAQEIVTDYRVYLLLTPQVHMTIAADGMDVAYAKLETVADKLAAQGKDVTELRAKIDDAKAHADPVPGHVLPLEPHGYPTVDKPVLDQARTDLQTARADLKAAVAIARSLAK
ncbi:MAG: hypothetical protein JO367_05485 [Actinobacteria bacterium]|nr:hypothetical protein [Actinomycetota bacterium]